MSDELSPAEFAKLHRLTPAEAVTYLQGRKKLSLTYDWRDLWHQEHAHQFTVSRLARLDLLKAVQEGIGASVNGDLSRRDFSRDLTALLQKEGWWGKKEVLDPVSGEIVLTTFDPARVKLIYDVNTRQAHSAGRWERIERNKGTHPYLRYITKRDERVRASHAAWDNLTLPIGHAFWDAHYPPNGWRCRCRAMSMTQAEYDAGHAPTGAALVKTAPKDEFKDWLNKRTGKPMRIPAGIDPGFDYNAGKAARANTLDKVVADKLAGAPPDLAAAAERAGLRAPMFEPQKTAKAAAQWAVDHNLADFADYAGVKPEVANAWNLSLFEHLQEFPELRKNQRFTGTTQAQYSRWYDIEVDRLANSLISQGQNPADARRLAAGWIKKPKTTGDRWAHSWDQPDVSGIAVNGKWGKDVEALKKSLADNVKSNYHPPGCDSIKSIVDHELGHQLDALCKLAADPEINTIYTELVSRNGVNDAVSRYAAKNINEFIAESWAEFRNNAAPRDVARAIGGIIQARYRSRFSSGF